MDSQLQIFRNPKFGQVRTVDLGGKVMFVGVDIAKSLGYKDPNSAITRHCRGSVKHPVPTESGIQSMNIIPEGDIFRLATKSELPGADEFESWVFDEVIPSIRKHGAYMTEDTLERAITDPDFLIRLATELKQERIARKQAEEKVQVMAPKAEFFDQVAESKDAIDIGSAAKVLNMGYGRNKLFEKLRESSILMDNNQPYQSYVDRGWFRVVEQKFTKPDGQTCINIKTLVYQKGLDGIRRLLQK